MVHTLPVQSRWSHGDCSLCRSCRQARSITGDAHIAQVGVVETVDFPRAMLVGTVLGLSNWRIERLEWRRERTVPCNSEDLAAPCRRGSPAARLPARWRRRGRVGVDGQVQYRGPRRRCAPPVRRRPLPGKGVQGERPRRQPQHFSVAERQHAAGRPAISGDANATGVCGPSAVSATRIPAVVSVPDNDSV